jgi:hypothetical protein
VTNGEPANSKRVFTIIIALFSAGVLFTAIFGFVVVRDVRANARDADLYCRTAAWASIAYACAHDGRYPTSDDDLRTAAPLPLSITCQSSSDAWPTTRDAALNGQSPPSFDTILARIKVHYSSDGTLPPVVDANGMPTLLDTNSTIENWMRSSLAAREGGASNE